MEKNSEILLYQTEDGQTKVEVRMENETVWLTQAQMVELFQTTKQNISLHIRNIFQDGELQEVSVVKEYLTAASDGKNYKTKYYNLDVIISVGYRVKSYRGTQFRIWATQQLKEFLIKGFVLNDERLKETGYTNQYFDELLQRIRDIR
ncbi:MAG: RhuM family protein, partial [Bacteroidales bacterium]|nr:RhuM family protein [Bacteroidales bacterium]